MNHFWHPLSVLLLADPVCFAAEGLLRTLLIAEGRVELVYAGDRMWPAVAHGRRFLIVAPGPEAAPAVGSAVVVPVDGIPELLRVSAVDGERYHLGADADPEISQTVSNSELIGVARLPVRPWSRSRARRRRRRLDLREAWSARPDSADDLATTVRDKYQSQAPFYVDSTAPEIESSLAARIHRQVPAGGRILVIGSGAGRECFGLARAGWQVTGLDFAPAMVEHARREATRHGLQIEFMLGDVRDYELGQNSFDAALFTYDVYSFIPGRNERVAALSRLRTVLRNDGTVFVSARRERSSYERRILVLQWFARGCRGERGDSHTRWIATDGRLRRSFVRVFSLPELRAECAAAGFGLEDWEAGHGRLQV